MGRRLIKVKRDIEGNNLGLYFFISTTPNKEIPRRFNLTTPKEDLMHTLYGYVICNAEYIS